MLLRPGAEEACMVERDHSAQDDDDIVPVFGTWRNIYVAVIVTTFAALGLIAVFESWSF
jgi:hypothetical protein